MEELEECLRKKEEIDKERLKKMHEKDSSSLKDSEQNQTLEIEVD